MGSLWHITDISTGKNSDENNQSSSCGRLFRTGRGMDKPLRYCMGISTQVPRTRKQDNQCVKSAKIWCFLWSVFSHIWTKYGSLET